MATSATAEEIESIKSLVSRYFKIYDIRVTYESLAFFISPNVTTLDGDFERLRIDFKARRLIPVLNYNAGEYVLTVVHRPELRTRSIWINLVLLGVTIFTTIFAGAVLWGGYAGESEIFLASNFIWGGLFFALPLMTILGVHELSHFYASKRHGVAASLPFFIPSIPPLGTFGAFISMRDPIPNRKALVDIGVAGPLGGLIVTIPVTLIGLWLTSIGDPVSGIVGPNGAISIILQPLYMLLALFVPVPDNVALHPMAFAAWVGFLVTAINLLPAGQLDGGHIARGLLGNNAKYLSYVTIVALFILGLFYTGWFIFALLIMFLGLRHPAPLNDVTALDKKRKALGVIALIILVVTFSPIPLVAIEPDYSFSMEVSGSNETTALAGSTIYFTMFVNNTGNTNMNMTIDAMQIPAGWSASLYEWNGSEGNATDQLMFPLIYEGNTTVILKIVIPDGTTTVNRTLSAQASSSGPNLSGKDEVKNTIDQTFTVHVV